MFHIYYSKLLEHISIKLDYLYKFINTRKLTFVSFYITIANKLPEPLLTNLVSVCCNLYLAFSGVSDNFA